MAYIIKDYIRTTHVYPPIPIRSEDWQAQWSQHDGDHPLRGSGSTEIEAVRDLLLNSLDGNEAEDVVEMAIFEWMRQRAKTAA